MALTESDSLPIGTAAPAFTLTDTASGQPVSLAHFAGRPVLIVFMCNHCPYVVHVLDELVRAAHDFATHDIVTVAISANDATAYPADAPDRMSELARAKSFPFPYLHDETQEVARAYRAVCTPEPFLFDADHALYYHGQIDDTRPNQGTDAHGADLRRAVDALLAGDPAPTSQTPSVGCGIKWKRRS